MQANSPTFNHNTAVVIYNQREQTVRAEVSFNLREFAPEYIMKAVTNHMKIINVRKQPEFLPQAIAYFAKSWGNKPIYQDCITHSLSTPNPLPVWYLLIDDSGEEATIAGGVGLITNDFISRMDLWPWLCALRIEENYRGQNLSALLIAQLKADVAAMGFPNLYLATDHVGFYEKHGFEYIGDGYHPWGDVSRIYKACL